MGSFPIPDFRQVVSVFADVLFVLDELVAEELLEMSADALPARDAVNHVPSKMKSIQVVQTVISNEVVVVPASLYPRTWKLS